MEYSLKPDFSILMANYNKANYIKTAIQSVINQTYKKWELIICDDGSTDTSLEKILPYLNDNRIRLLKGDKNIGCIKTQIKLINQAKADIVGILDSDDTLDYNALKIILQAYQNTNYGFIYSQFIYCDENLKPIRKGFCQAIPSGKSSLNYDYVSHFKTFKKKCYFKTSGYNEKLLYAEDKDIILKMEEVTKLLFIDKYLYKYRIIPDSQGHNPKRKLIGELNYLIAKYQAHKRRKHLTIPRLTKLEVLHLWCKILLKWLKYRVYILHPKF